MVRLVENFQLGCDNFLHQINVFRGVDTDQQTSVSFHFKSIYVFRGVDTDQQTSVSLHFKSIYVVIFTNTSLSQALASGFSRCARQFFILVATSRELSFSDNSSLVTASKTCSCSDLQQVRSIH